MYLQLLVKKYAFCILKVVDIKIRIRDQVVRSKDPDPYQNVTDLELRCYKFAETGSRCRLGTEKWKPVLWISIDFSRPDPVLEFLNNLWGLGTE